VWRVAACVLAATLLTSAERSLAGPPPSQETLQKLIANRQEIVRKSLQLDPAQRVQFEPVFADYEKERLALAEQRDGIADDFTKSALTLSGPDASKLLDRMVNLRKQRVELDDRFRPRFEAVLPPQKVLLLFELNYILDAVVSYDLAGTIPLVQ
jgi:hypothetical protein